MAAMMMTTMMKAMRTARTAMMTAIMTAMMMTAMMMTAMTSDDHITGAQIGNPNDRLQPAPHTNMKEGKRTVTSEMTDGVNQNFKSISVRTTVMPAVTRFVTSECEAEWPNEDR